MNRILTVTANPAIDRVYFVDDFVMGEVRRPRKTVFTPGGKGLNVSRVASLLGADVTAMGFAGGYTGDFIKAEIRKTGISEKFTDIQGETRICVNITDKTGASGEILEKGPSVTADEEKMFLDSFRNNIKECDVITVSGSLPEGLTTDFYGKIAAISAQENKKTIFDTSGKALTEIVKAKPYMKKPNKDEFLQFTGQERFEAKKALLILKELGVEVPFISLGKDGAVAMIDGRFCRFSVPVVKVINSVGSGDSTVAGIATGISRKMSLCDSIRLGMAAGISNTQFESTGVISKKQVEELYNSIEVTFQE